MKYDLIPFHEDYLINKKGQIITNQELTTVIKQYPSKKGPYVLLNEEKYLVIDLMVKTFYGNFIGKIGFKDKDKTNVSRDNIICQIESFDIIDEKNILINGVLYKQIPGYSRYYITNDGVIYSSISNIIMSHKYNDGHEYSCLALINDCGTQIHLRVHRLVWSAWVGPLSEEDIINHKDERKYNNDLSNLEVGDTLYNTRYSILSGKKHVPFDYETVDKIIQLSSEGKYIRDIINILNLPKDSYKKIQSMIYRVKMDTAYSDLREKYNLGEPSKRPEIDIETVHRICEKLSQGVKASVISRMFNVAYTTVERIKHRRRWKEISQSYVF